MTARQALTDERKEVFLQVRRQTGSIRAAAAASPHAAERDRPGYETFRDAINHDSEFAAQVAEAKNAALGKVEQAIAERAFSPEETPIFSKGEVVGYRRSYRDANNLLLRLAERLSDDWAPKKNVKGEVEHKAVFGLTTQHLDMLNEPEREQLLGLLETIEQRSKSNGVKRIPSESQGATEDSGSAQ